VQNLNISCDNSETVRDRMSVSLLLITNSKSHTGFRLVSTSMTLNDLERRNSPYFAFFSRNSTDFQADYMTVIEDRSIMSVKSFKALRTGYPPYLSNLLQHHEPARSLRSSSSHYLSVPRHNLKFGSRAFRFSAPTVWNSLPISRVYP